MTWKKGQSGNPNGRAKDKIWGDAIRIAVNEAVEGGDRKKLRALADKLVEKALSGDITAMKEIGDRLDGKAAQSVDMSVGTTSYVALMPEKVTTPEEWQARHAPKAIQ